jgi:hypothetical protein
LGFGEGIVRRGSIPLLPSRYEEVVQWALSIDRSLICEHVHAFLSLLSSEKQLTSATLLFLVETGFIFRNYLKRKLLVLFAGKSTQLQSLRLR